MHPTGGSLRVFKQSAWLEVGSVKMALSRPAHQRVTQADRYAADGRDEVLQYKKNGHEVGHHTRHLDRDENLIHENYHGITSVPDDAKLA